MPAVSLLLNTVRVVVFLLALVPFIAGCSICDHIGIQLPSRLSRSFRRRHYHRLWNGIIRFWGRGIWHLGQWILGIGLRIEGESPRGRHLVVSNHQSTVDIIALFEALPTLNLKFLAKSELARGIPNVSHALRHGGFGIVDFSNRRSTLRGLRSFAKSELARGIPNVSHALRHGGFGIVDFSNRRSTLRGLRSFAKRLEEWDASPLIFPEGARTFDGSIGPFQRTGLLVLARDSGLPVLPVVIDGAWEARSLGRFFVHLPGSRIRIRILPPLDAGTVALRRDELHTMLEAMMRDELHKMRAAGAAA